MGTKSHCILGIDKDSKGRFLPGHRASVKWEPIRKVNQIRDKLWEVVETEDIAKLYHEMLDLALNAEDPRVRLAGCQAVKEWLIGKEPISIDLTHREDDIPVRVDVSPEDLAAIKRVLGAGE